MKNMFELTIFLNINISIGKNILMTEYYYLKIYNFLFMNLIQILWKMKNETEDINNHD